MEGTKLQIMQEVKSYKELVELLKKNKTNYVLIYKAGSQQSDCAYKNLQEIGSIDGVNIYTVNVAEVRDVHKHYSVTTAPTLLEFEGDRMLKSVKGCNTPQYYKSLFENSLFTAVKQTEGKTQKPVIVYSTPSCPWCNRLKQYLRQNNIRFRDIDVSKDQKAAEEMVKKSGQQGVPQALIGGEIVVGFDKKKIDKLLGIKVQ
jgi:glutaredoxin-like YruB-family protein